MWPHKISFFRWRILQNTQDENTHAFFFFNGIFRRKSIVDNCPLWRCAPGKETVIFCYLSSLLFIFFQSLYPFVSGNMRVWPQRCCTRRTCHYIWICHSFCKRQTFKIVQFILYGLIRAFRLQSNRIITMLRLTVRHLLSLTNPINALLVFWPIQQTWKSNISCWKNIVLHVVHSWTQLNSRRIFCSATGYIRIYREGTQDSNHNWNKFGKWKNIYRKQSARRTLHDSCLV